MSELQKAHLKEFDCAPEIVVGVPKVMTIAGNFADLIGGKAVLCAVADGLSVSMSRREDNVVRVVNLTKQDKKKFSLSGIKYRREDKWANATKAIIGRLVKNGCSLGGMNIVLSGSLAGADSYSLSAASFVGVALAADQLFGLGLTRDRLMTLCLEANSLTPSYVARWCDLWILLHAQQGKVYLYDYSSGQMKDADFPADYHTYVLNSSLPYSILTPEEQEYRNFVAEILAENAASSFSGEGLRSLSFKERRHAYSSLPEAKRRALEHVAFENECAEKIFASIVSRSTPDFGQYLFQLARSIIVNAELTSPETDWIFRRGQETAYVVGLTMVGVGIAGTFLVLIDESIPSPYAQNSEDYERIFGFRPKVCPFVPSSSAAVVGETSSCAE